MLLLTPRLLRLALLCGCHRDDCEDVVQEALLRGAARPPVDPESLRPFLDAVVRRLVSDRYRDRQRQLRLSQHAGLEPTPTDSHETAVCDQHEGAWLALQADLLRPREREALLARASGLSNAQIAANMATTGKAVEMLVRRGRQVLAALLVSGYAIAGMLAVSAPPGSAPSTGHHNHARLPRQSQRG